MMMPRQAHDIERVDEVGGVVGGEDHVLTGNGVGDTEPAGMKPLTDESGAEPVMTGSAP